MPAVGWLAGGQATAAGGGAAAPAPTHKCHMLAPSSLQIKVEHLEQDNESLLSRVSVLEGKVLPPPAPAPLAAAAAAEVEEALAAACAALEERAPQPACGTLPQDRTEPLCTVVIPDSESEGEASVQTSPCRSVPGPVKGGDASQA